jgi:predicted flap endonuclease-1-like 5' DNA nuclease
MNEKKFIYTDVRLTGDAWHVYKLKPYDCKELVDKHIHSCTILIPSEMLNNIYKARDYFYDEEMKQGYEDWEFSIAALKAGWCGKYLDKPLFNYRNHVTGSMRTDAREISTKLVSYVKSKHRKKDILMACKSCGGSRKAVTKIKNYGGKTMAKVIVSNLGEFDQEEILRVHYRGSTQSTMTKVGGGGTIYKYSSKQEATYPPDFDIHARDAHLFSSGPFDIKLWKIEKEVVEDIPPPEPTPEYIASLQKKTSIPPKKEEVAFTVEEIFVPEDLTQIKYIGAVSAQKLTDAGFSFYADIADSNLTELAMVLGYNEKKTKEVKASANGMRLPA